MELLVEIFLTAIVAVLFSFLIAKLVSVAMSVGSVAESESKSGTDVDDEIIMQDLQFGERLEVKAFESERKVEFVEEIVSEAKDFGAAAAQVEEFAESVVSGPELETESHQQPKKSESEVKLDDVLDEESFGMGKGTGVEIESASEVADAKEESPKADKAAESASLSREMEAEACQLQGKSESEVKFDDPIEGKVEKIEVGEMVTEKSESEVNKEVGEMVAEKSESEVNKEVGEMVPEKSESEVKFDDIVEDKVENKDVQEVVQEKSESEVKCDDVVQEKVENREVKEIGEEFETKKDQEAQSDEFSVGESKLERLGGEEKEVKLESDDDWEGIERSELEKVFAVAVKFIEDNGELEGMESDVKMEMYGLHKVATEGPCREPQPMPLKMSARTKWVESCYV